MPQLVEALVERLADGNEVRVLSPIVAWYGQAPRVGEVLVGGSRAGRLTQLGRRVELVLPAGVSGRVAARSQRTRLDPVGYGEELLRLVPVASAEVDAGVSEPTTASRLGLPDGTFAIASSTHGMFYRRPGPDQPPYVEVGQVVEHGATLALVEVMKCFSAITYSGDGLPSRAEIVEARAADGSEVQTDQVLFVVKPA